MQKLTVGLIGNPNAGKTTLFNALTGAHQRVGNWPGVTVEHKSGYFEIADTHIEIVDLPGIYDLSVTSKDGAIDERIAAEYLLSNNVDLIVNVVDANNLERNLYLTSQLLELQIPIVLAVNMVDVAKKRGITIDITALEQSLKCPVIPLISSKGTGIEALRQAILTTANFGNKINCAPTITPAYQKCIHDAIKAIANEIKLPHSYFLAIRLLENDVLAQQYLTFPIDQITQQQKIIQETLDEDVDMLIADARYTMIHDLVKKVVIESIHIKPPITKAIDKVVLNRVLGIPIFLGVMYLMFLFSIKIGGAFQDFFQLSSNAIFVDGLKHLLTTWHLPLWLVSILTAGIGKGINTTITFIPVLGSMFLFLAMLEGSGYMARAGFVIDKLMTAIGLPGKSFVPMLIGFGCNVPAIMAARTLDNKRDRILTVLMTPFMSCGARFAIYAVFTAAFFPHDGQNVVFALYLIGILIAILTGLVLRKTVLKGQHASLIMELPPYHLPTLKNTLMQTWCRLKSFILKAGQIIVPICLVLGTLNSINIGKYSVLAHVGKNITPVFQPMGIKQDNWPATVGLITGVVAKEVVVGTLNTLYAQEQPLKKDTTFNLGTQLQHAVLTIPTNLKNIFINTSKGKYIDFPLQNQNHIYGQMYKKFHGPAGGFAYLLFVLLYFPCIPAVATIFRELGHKWATFSMLWNTGIAYGSATLFYQAATFVEHPIYSTISIVLVLLVFGTTVLCMKRCSNNINQE